MGIFSIQEQLYTCRKVIVQIFRSILPSIRCIALFYLFDPGFIVLGFTGEETEAQRSRTLSGSQADKMQPSLELRIPSVLHHCPEDSVLSFKVKTVIRPLGFEYLLID